MGQVWQKDASGQWQEVSLLARTSSGWRRGATYWSKINGVWTQLWTKDVTAPSAPLITSLTYSASTKKITIKVEAPGDSDLQSLDLRMSTTKYPVDNQSASNAFPGNTVSAKPDQTYTFTMSYTKTNTTYYFSAFAIDQDKNVSAKNVKSLNIPTPTVPTPPPPPPASAPTVYRATISTVGSGSFSSDYTNWYPEMLQGGEHAYHACWFYSARLSNITAQARKIRKMTIRVQRSSSANGVPGEANVNLILHNMANRASTQVYSNSFIKIGTLGRGEAGTFNVPTIWWDDMQGRTYWKGLGLYGGRIPYTSVDYLVAYGYGTRSGEIYIEYEK